MQVRWSKQIMPRVWAEGLNASVRALLKSCRNAIGRQRFFGSSRRLGQGGGNSEDWRQRLEEEKNFLLGLIQGIETEFLTIGRAFEGWAEQLNIIQQECRSLSDLTLGQTQEAPVQFAFQLLKKAEDLMLASYEQYDHVFATFGELQQRLAELSQRHDLLPINFIALSIRIEASRQPPEIQEVFSVLAANVCRTVDEVRSTLDHQFAELAASERMAGTVMGGVFEAVQRHRQEVSCTMKDNRALLSALNEAIRGAGAGAANLAQLNQAISGHVGELVLAQQCQDISRQKIEHVGEAIETMSAHLGETGAGPRAIPPQTIQFVYQAAQIQLKQIEDVFAELKASAKNLELGIQNLRTDGGAATSMVVKVGETMLQANVARQCEASMGQIVVTIQQAVQKTAEILSALDPLQARFQNCTQQATRLARDVRLAALNAQIFAIHAPQGATLEVLAGNIRITSDETMEQVEQLGSGLQQASEMINGLRQRLTDFEEIAQFEQVILGEEATISQKKLLELDGAIPLLIGRITQQQAGFAQSAESILADIKFPAVVAAASVRSIGFFQELVAWGEAQGAKVSAGSGSSRDIDSLRSKYTMASEQQTHAAAMGTAAGQSSAASASVELFDMLAPESLPMAEDPSDVAPAGSGANMPVTAPELPLTPCLPDPSKPAPKPAQSAPGEDLGQNVEMF
jgi:hypothetical protein